jgi:DNA-binding LytR/AlgR family response regulator
MPIHVVQIDSDRHSRSLSKSIFRVAEPSINLRQFVTADEALPYIEQQGHLVDLFLIDIPLSGAMNGVQLAQAIRDLKCPGFIVLTSAYAAPSYEKLVSLHSEFCAKPWHILTLARQLPQYKLAKSAAAHQGHVSSR